MTFSKELNERNFQEFVIYQFIFNETDHTYNSTKVGIYNPFALKVFELDGLEWVGGSRPSELRSSITDCPFEDNSIED
jgi:hypothetical protein